MSDNRQTYENVADYVKNNLDSISKEQLAELAMNTIIKQQSQIDQLNNLNNTGKTIIGNLTEENFKKEAQIEDLIEKNKAKTKTINTLKENLNQKEEMLNKSQEYNRELKKENFKLKTRLKENGLEATHLTSGTKTSFTVRAFNKAKNKVKEFFNKLSNVKDKIIETSKDKTESFILEKQKKYHNNFQKTRAFSKTVNDLTLKPTVDITKRTYKKTKNKLEKIHLKTQSNLSKEGLDKTTTANYTVMFVAVATEEAGKKIYQVTGAKKVVNMAANSKIVKKVQKATESAVSTYKENFENNKNKAKEMEQKIKNKKEAIQEKNIEQPNFVLK